MNTSRTTPASSDTTSYARTPFCRRARPLKTVRACAPSQNPGPMADWWARHTNGGASSAAKDALTTHTDEDIVEDTVAAFRTALRQADGIDSAADIQDDAATETGDDASTDSLDYFAPAFRQALGPDERRTATSGAKTGDGATGDSAPVTEETPAESLHYFVPALPGGSAREERAAPLRKTFLHTDESGDEDPAETKDPERSLDYFAPAFRRALGRTHDSGTEISETETNRDEETQGTAEQLKTAMKAMSRREILHLSGLERSGVSDLDLDLDRFAKRFFTSPSRKLASLNGN